ncbi:MAG: 4-hydroxy-tetrahydrodipicolinate reductase [Tenuifilaceae bacterium]
MKIALIGYGKMGHEIESIANSRGHQIVLKIDKDNLSDLTSDNLKLADVAIEFSTPHTVFQNIKTCLLSDVPIVVGTTGWLDKLDEVKEIIKSGTGTLFFASNYSIGVNLFFRMNKVLASYLNDVKGYQPAITEIHHIQKLDSPSGTAITLAQIISESIDEINGWTLLPAQESNKIPIESIREGTVPGTHILTYNSDMDEIVLTHKAKNRKGFAIGAVLAAEFIAGKKGFFTMDDLLKIK